MPPPVRITIFCLPVTSQAMPKRGPHCERRAVLQVLGEAVLAALADAVGDVAGSGHDVADDRRQAATVSGHRIDRRAHAVDELRLVQARRLRRDPTGSRTKVDACSEASNCGWYQAARRP